MIGPVAVLTELPSVLDPAIEARLRKRVACTAERVIRIR